MKRPHLLRVEESPEQLAPLIAACAAAGLRCGWLDLRPPAGAPADLVAATGAGALRAVAAGGGQSVAVKALRGQPVMQDLLREHFRGCAVVLVRGETDGPRLAASGEDWTVTLGDGVARRLTSAELAAALRSPRPFGAHP